jgi:hypothetical protein
VIIARRQVITLGVSGGTRWRGCRTRQAAAWYNHVLEIAISAGPAEADARHVPDLVSVHPPNPCSSVFHSCLLHGGLDCCNYW